MKRLILRIYDYLSQHKAVAALIVALLLGAAALSLTRLNFEENISAFLPETPEVKRYNEVYSKMGIDKMAVFFEGGTLDERIEAMADFEAVWAQKDSAGMVPDFRSSTNDASDILDVLSFIGANEAYFLREEDYDRMDSLLSDKNFPDEKLKAQREAMYTAVSSRYLRTDPLGLFTPVLGRLAKLNPGGRSQVIDGYLFTEDAGTGIVFFDSPFGGSESGKNAALVALMDSVKAGTGRLHPEVTISSTGGPEVAVSNATTIKRDSFLALGIAALLIFLILWLSYKRFSDVLWMLISISAGAIIALGVISLWKSSISIIILGIGSTIIGIAVNYPLHYVDHLKYQSDKRKALADQVNPLLVGNITTVGAFLSLMLLKAEALRDFGFIGAVMLLGTILFSLVFLPVFVPEARKPRKTIKLDLDRHINLPPKARKTIFGAFIVLTAVLWLLGRGVAFDADMHHINYMTPSQERGFELLSSLSATAEGNVYLVSEAGDADRALEAASTLPMRDSLVSIVDFIPSLEMQRERLEKWNSFLAAHPSLKTDLAAAAARNGFTETAFQPFFELLDRQWTPQEASYFAPLSESVGKNMFLPGEDKVQVVSILRSTPESAQDRAASLRAGLPDGTFCFCPSELSGSMVRNLSEDFDTIGLLCSLIVFFFLLLSFRSLDVSLISFLPLAAGWIWILGFMRIFSMEFNIVNIILATFIFGQGDDYSIFITEGLMYEYATGKKILHSFKNAVMLSALIMFIGIGALIVSRHPAMRSLAEVIFIGMVTVVLMAWYLPPLIFRFLTEKKGKYRRTPLTLKQFLLTVYIFTVFLIAMFCLSIRAFTLNFGKMTDERRLRYHRRLQSVAKMAFKLLPGCPYSSSNPHGEDFEKPAIFICNHQSHLDVLALIALTPKLVLLTNDWVWNSPFYGYLIRKAEYFPASDGYEKNSDRLKEMVSKGYSIAIFPEGTRSEDCHIQRFHRGAFLLAKELKLDILPMMIHGFGYALPKHDFLLRKAALHLRIGRRIPWQEIPEDVSSYTKEMRHRYQSEYAKLCSEIETPEYQAPFVRYRYLYKGHDASEECRRYLTKNWFEKIALIEAGEAVIANAGCGVLPMLLAPSRRDIEVRAYEEDEEKYLTALRCRDIPANLKYINAPAPDDATLTL